MHPLVNFNEMSDSDLELKLTDLTRRYYQTTNPQAQQQIINLMEDYRLELKSRHAKKNHKESENEEQNALDNLIKIS